MQKLQIFGICNCFGVSLFLFRECDSNSILLIAFSSLIYSGYQINNQLNEEI
ncbi:unnamed protein product [Brassica oleracea var. botrytis]|uniref:Uncharacterized protein n=2 Tax=Brassica TaxID=3705 RepID=A0A3P6B0W0_BRAOL|nr:unnamed protein product [Brassica napus]VDC94639.1 unnamed protein product [Brassica oleracea]